MILDMHGAPGGQTGDNIDDSWGYPFLFESAESQELTVKIWVFLAVQGGGRHFERGIDNPPADWNAMVTFADGPRTTFEEVRKNRPPKEKAQKALNDFLEGMKLANCRINQGYLKALGL